MADDTYAHGTDSDSTSSDDISSDDIYRGEFYCVKCKDKRQSTGEVHVSDKGTRMAKATCPICGTTVNRILGRV